MEELQSSQQWGNLTNEQRRVVRREGERERGREGERERGRGGGRKRGLERGREGVVWNLIFYTRSLSPLPPFPSPLSPWSHLPSL